MVDIKRSLNGSLDTLLMVRVGSRRHCGLVKVWFVRAEQQVVRIDPQGKADDDPGRQKATGQQKRRIWTGYKDSWRGIELEFRGAVRKNFVRQERELIEKLKKAWADHAGGIPLNQPFMVGGEALMYPADPNGSAAMIINCRCLQIAIRARGKNYTLDHYERVKFISYAECDALFAEAA